MSFDAQVYRLFIASPSDVAEERDIVREVVSEWNATHAASRSIVLLPVGWDTDAIPQVGRRPQQAINEDVLASCDLLVGIFWNRCGSDAGTGLTGTEEEIEEHIKAGRPAMLYFSDKEGSPSVIDPDQMKAVRAFRSKIERERTAQYGTFKTTGDFRQKFFKDLAITMNKLPAQTPKLRTQSLLMADEDGLADGGEITTLQFRARSQRMSPSQGEHQTMEFTWNELFAILAPLIAQREFKITLKSEMEAEILRRVSSKGLLTAWETPITNVAVTDGEYARAAYQFQDRGYVTQNLTGLEFTERGARKARELSTEKSKLIRKVMTI